jgi:cytochrome b6-f complex iron-sulfur subunit
MGEPTDASVLGHDSKPAVKPTPAPPAKPVSSKQTQTETPEGESELFRQRRRIVWTAIVGYLAVSFLMFLRYFFPRTLFEPSTVFKVGYPSDFAIGVDTRFQKQYRVAVVREPERLFVIFLKCTHLGCTPDWKPADDKFKCPCHGSGYTSEGINFEGPAPRPMDRARVEADVDGQIVVDTGKLFSWPKGQRSEFDDPGAFLVV